MFNITGSHYNATYISKLCRSSLFTTVFDSRAAARAPTCLVISLLYWVGGEEGHLGGWSSHRPLP